MIVSLSSGSNSTRKYDLAVKNDCANVSFDLADVNPLGCQKNERIFEEENSSSDEDNLDINSDFPSLVERLKMRRAKMSVYRSGSDKSNSRRDVKLVRTDVVFPYDWVVCKRNTKQNVNNFRGNKFSSQESASDNVNTERNASSVKLRRQRAVNGVNDGVSSVKLKGQKAVDGVNDGDIPVSHKNCQGVNSTDKDDKSCRTDYKPILNSTVSFTQHSDAFMVTKALVQESRVSKLQGNIESIAVSNTSGENECLNSHSHPGKGNFEVTPSSRKMDINVHDSDLEPSKDDREGYSNESLNVSSKSCNVLSNGSCSVPLFDSPAPNIYHNNCSVASITPNHEEYVQKLRKKFKLVSTSTPNEGNLDSNSASCYTSNLYSPLTSLTEDNKEDSPLSAPLSLAERLRKKLHTTPNILRSSNL